MFKEGLAIAGETVINETNVNVKLMVNNLIVFIAYILLVLPTLGDMLAACTISYHFNHYQCSYKYN